MLSSFQWHDCYFSKKKNCFFSLVDVMEKDRMCTTNRKHMFLDKIYTHETTKKKIKRINFILQSETKYKIKKMIFKRREEKRVLMILCGSWSNCGISVGFTFICRVNIFCFTCHRARQHHKITTTTTASTAKGNFWVLGLYHLPICA